MLIVKCIVVLLGVHLSPIYGYVADIADSRECYSDMVNIGGFPRSGSYKILRGMFGRNCTHIIGNLILTDIYVDENGADPDLSFLQSIREITGYLIIMYANVRSIPLTNLRVIWANNGGYKIQEDSEPAALVVRKNYKNNMTLGHIDLRNLRSIVRGNVYVYDNPGLCYWPDMIDWNELFETPGEQQIFDSNQVEKQYDYDNLTATSELYRPEKPPPSVCSNVACSSSCPENSGRRSCWGPLATDCQKYSKCNKVSCNRCFLRKSEQICCHEQCLGGCWGPLATQCESCKEYNNSGKCVDHCPQRNVVKNGKLLTNLDFKYALGKQCVSECPPGFLIENDACVTHCSTSGFHAIGRVCQPCEGRCPKVCTIEKVQTVGGQSVQLMDAESLKNLTNCTYLRGNLVISAESYQPSKALLGHEPITKVEQLWALHSLEEVSGYVYLDLGYFGNKLLNLSFLENLVKVGGYLSKARAGIMIMNSGAQIPGLRSLRDVARGNVVFYNNSRLCYLHTLPWMITSGRSKEVSGNMRIVHTGPDGLHCAVTREECHPACDSRFGCWGPGRDQCVRCRYKRAGRHDCVETCETLNGYISDFWSNKKDQAQNSILQYSPLRNQTIHSYGSPDADYVCTPCHSECKHTCSGPGADQCIGDCKTAWAEGKCVAKCGPDSYLNVDRRICEPCQSHCHQRQLTHQPVCTGPGRYPGKGGCNKCEKFIVAASPESITLYGHPNDAPSMSLLCLRGDCPPETYLTTEVVKRNSVFSAFTETFTNVIPICRPCHPRCTRCSSYSLLEATKNRLGCIICAGYWFRETCVEQCPVEETYTVSVPDLPSYEAAVDAVENSTTIKGQSNQMKLDKIDRVTTRHMNGRCLACNFECHNGCWGPEPNQCHHCLHFRFYLDLLSSSSIWNYSEPIIHAWNISRQEFAPSLLPKHDIFSKFLCLPSCPDNFMYAATDPFSGDQLCYTEKVLSDYHKGLIIKDNTELLLLLDPNSPRSIGTVHQSYDSVMFWIALVCVIVALLFVCYCCCRFKQQKLNKQRYQSTSLSQFLFCPTFGPWKSNANPAGDQYFDGPMGTVNTGDAIGMNILSGQQDSSLRGTASTLNPQFTLSNSGTYKPPNLGRLVMINSDDLILDEHYGPLGTGAFGAVYRGVWKMRVTSEMNGATPNENVGVSEKGTSADTSGNTECHLEQPEKPQMSNGTPNRYRMVHVAVKILNDSRGPNDLQALLDEARVMASVSHPHCLPLLGMCLSQSRRCLVSAYVVSGSLDRYLKVHAPDLPSTLLLQWAAQIASGMAYLESLGIIHRDLATRNVLVTARDHLQITDFGLAKVLEEDDEESHGEVIVRSGRVPIRWLAVETLTHGRYSFKTDVWAYGVTIWEIFTFGEKPYSKIETANVKSHILSGNRLKQPELCTLQLYQIMLSCWEEDPEDRPTFSELYQTFAQSLKEPMLYLMPKVGSNRPALLGADSTGGDTRSRVTIYPSFKRSSYKFGRPIPLTKHWNSASPFQAPNILYGSGATTASSSSSRRFDPRRRTRNSLMLPHTILLASRQGKQQQQKRCSTGGRTDQTLSTSVSGLSDRWSHSSFPHHSHSALPEVSESGLAMNKTSQFNMDMQNTGKGRNAAPFNSSVLSSDSWASSHQPLISSDQDSSLSQLMLTNFGYTSSESRSSMLTPSTALSTLPPEQCSGDASPLVHTPEQSVQTNTVHENPTTAAEVVSPPQGLMPANFQTEAAAGYVWPQWPLAFAETDLIPSDNSFVEGNGSSTPGLLTQNESDINLPFLNRQLWRRRNARQRQYYLRQLRLNRSALGMSLPEQTVEEAVEENSAWDGPPDSVNSGELNDADGSNGGSQVDENSSNRYCPNPTS